MVGGVTVLWAGLWSDGRGRCAVGGTIGLWAGQWTAGRGYGEMGGAMERGRGLNLVSVVVA